VILCHKRVQDSLMASDTTLTEPGYIFNACASCEAGRAIPLNGNDAIAT
jgi:hypothetical protein